MEQNKAYAKAGRVLSSPALIVVYFNSSQRALGSPARYRRYADGRGDAIFGRLEPRSLPDTGRSFSRDKKLRGDVTKIMMQ